MKKPDIKKQSNILIKHSTEMIDSFKQFIFAPNLLTFVISVVVGNALGSTVKQFVETIKGLISFILNFAFGKHPLNWNLILDPIGELIGSISSIIIIAFSVFILIRFINDKLLTKENEKWGYDQAHTDQLELQKLLKQNNQLQVENQKLNQKILSQLNKSAK